MFLRLWVCLCRITYYSVHMLLQILEQINSICSLLLISAPDRSYSSLSGRLVWMVENILLGLVSMFGGFRESRISLWFFPFGVIRRWAGPRVWSGQAWTEPTPCAPVAWVGPERRVWSGSTRHPSLGTRRRAHCSRGSCHHQMQNHLLFTVEATNIKNKEVRGYNNSIVVMMVL